MINGVASEMFVISVSWHQYVFVKSFFYVHSVICMNDCFVLELGANICGGMENEEESTSGKSFIILKYWHGNRFRIRKSGLQ